MYDLSKVKKGVMMKSWINKAKEELKVKSNKVKSQECKA